MSRTKTVDTKDTEKPLLDEKIVEVEEADIPIETEDKPEVIIPPEIEPDEEDSVEDEVMLDTEEIDPFGDKWEQ